ncbi:antibiotic biosynthesis monooxygenase [Synechococcus moorigangaii CMS01]|nr:antibiotic biosynthesis monooxygenase [Synechococcus moorigangaii CMS01]
MNDCLRHKVAYVAIGEFKPGRFAQAQNLYEKAVSSYSEGFRGAFLLQKIGSEGDKGIAMILWDNIEDMDNNQTELSQKIMAEMSPLFVAPPETDFYQVCSEIKP